MKGLTEAHHCPPFLPCMSPTTGCIVPLAMAAAQSSCFAIVEASFTPQSIFESRACIFLGGSNVSAKELYTPRSSGTPGLL